MAENYEIQLGIGLNDSDFSDIKTKIKSLEDDRIKIKLDTKDVDNQIDGIKKQLQDLNKGNNKNLFTLDTSKLESSLTDVKNIITDIKNALGTIDNSKGINSLVSSVSQISKVLDTASNKIEGLSGELSALSKKDFSINLGIDMGKKNLSTVAYGRAARKQVIPELESQIKELESLLGGQQATMKKITQNGKEVGFDIFSDFNDFNSDSAIKKMEAMEKYVNSLKKLASIEGIKLDGFNDIHKNASELINDITGVENAVDKAEDTVQKFKNMFGSGIDVEGLSAALDPILQDLKAIRESIGDLSKGASIDGLTASFNRLSDVLDKLDANFDKIKNSLGEGFSGGNAVKAAQQTGQKIWKTVSKSAKQSLNLDDVIDEQVLKLMNEYAISGKKGSKAFDEIKQSLVDFRNGSGDINKVTSAISNNMKVVNEAKNDYKELAEHIKMFNASGAKVHVPDSIRQEYGDDYKSMRSQLGKAFTSGQGMDFESFIEETNSILGQTIDLSHGAEAAFGDLVRKINSTKGGKFLTGDDLFKSGILDMGDVVANVSTSLEKIENAEEEIARASSNVTNISFDNVENDLKQVTVTAENAADVLKNMREALSSMKFNNTSIDAITSDLEEMGVAISKISVKDNGVNLDVTVKGVDSVGRAVTEVRRLNAETNEISTVSKSISQSFDREAKEVQETLKELKNIATQMGKLETDIFKLDGNSNAREIEVLENQLNSLRVTYEKLWSTININNPNLQIGDFKKLDSVFEKTENKLAQLKAKMSDTSALKETNEELRELENLAKQIGSLEVKIKGLDGNKNANEVAELTSELKRLQDTYDKLIASFNVNNPNINLGDIGNIDNIFAETEDKLKQLDAKFADTRTKLANDIRLNIELGNFEDDLTSVYAKLDKLSSKAPELSIAIERVESAFKELNEASELNEDGVVDTERLIQAQKEYAAEIEKTNNLINKQARLEAKESRNQKLRDDREIYQAKIDAWMTKNSAAVNKFGDKLLELRAKAQNADRVELNHLEKELIKVDKAADKAGLKMMSLGDRIKDKAKEYMAYFSVAEIFMEVTQAMKRMFDTVVEIDTAMTGLYRVTDLTSAQYDILFDNMISSAKEYGATLNDIINATTDWVRAGFDADTSLGLAEVTTMYQHISDLDYDTAAENLITAYNGFKDELNGAFSGDTVSAVGYIADILNELDNNYAATSAGIGEALTRSASALDLAGNSIQETAGMITGIIEVTQDPEQAGSTLKILSLRLRGKPIMPPYKESLYALFELKYDLNIEDNYICQNARVA